MVSVLIRKVRSKVIANLASKMLAGTFPESAVSEYSKQIPVSDDIKEIAKRYKESAK